MKTAILTALLVLLMAPVAWAAEEPAEVAVEVALFGGSSGETCEQTAEPMTDDELRVWAMENGFDRVVSPASVSASAPTCPQVISCNATHCIETSFCAVTDLGSNTCCRGAACLLCLPGQTVKVERCRCAGGGCMNRFSQRFFCA